MIKRIADFVIAFYYETRMNTAASYGLFIPLLMLASGCKEQESLSESDYYVKYEVNSTSIYMGGTLDVQVAAENSHTKTFTIDTRKEWEVVIGPVEKGFETKIVIDKNGTDDNRLELFAQISVSKDLGPFAVKQFDDSDANRNFLELSYIIDF